MPEEIRAHFMGHKLKDRVREAYFLADPDELMNNYLRYMEYVTVKENNSPVSLDEFRQLKKGYESLRNENRELHAQISDILDQITPDEDLINEDQKLSEALNGVMYDNQLYQNQITEMKGLLQNMQLELEELKNKA